MSALKDTTQWFNELGSQMTLVADAKGGLTGSYMSTVGNAKRKYSLVGRYFADEEYPTLGWVVQWSNEYMRTNHVTTWSGQYQIIDGESTILTTWLLTSQTGQIDDWESTLVGQDIFTTKQPHMDAVSIMQKRKRQAFPRLLIEESF